MKYIDRSSVPAPKNLQGQTAPVSEDDISDSIYGHADVKKALTDLQKGICCYCESHYDVTGYGEVEHFRPKGGWKQDKEDKKLHHPGYYWLAYKWENLMYACKKCNLTYKKNFFPLEEPDKRFKEDTLDISLEKPLLINPYEEQHPENHLTFDGPVIRALSVEGTASIIYYGLDRVALEEERRKIFNPLNALAKAAKLLQGKDKEETVDELKKCLNDLITSGQYTMMLKCNFGEYVIEK